MNYKTLLSIASVVGASNAFALNYSDVDAIGVKLGLSAQPGAFASYTGVFDIRNTDSDQSITINTGTPLYADNGNTYTSALGFQPGVEFVTYAEATFYFRDDYTTLSPTEPTGETESVTVKLNGNSFLSGQVQNRGFSINGGEIIGSIFTALNADGELTYKVEASSGDFHFDYAILRATTDIPSVPEAGSTVLLLGISSLGMALAGRKLKA